jgi:peptide/nickel transport system permease protein
VRPLARALRRRPIVLIALGAVAALFGFAVIGPALVPFDPTRVSRDVLQPPGGIHLLGTDHLGRDVLAQLASGARVTAAVGLATAVAATFIGLLVGAASAYYAGPLDALLMRTTEFFQIVPTFILAAVVVALVGAGLTTVILVLALLAWPQVARVTRAEVLRLKSAPFVDVGRCLGMLDHELVAREILPNAMAPVVALGTVIVAQAILLQAGLSFLGLSDPSLPSWGNMLNVGQVYLGQAWWLSAFPGVAIVITVIAFNVLGDAFQDLLTPVRTR